MANPIATHKTVVVAGNPNSGKTTVFNSLAGTRYKVANYPGVTVERVQANLTLPGGERILLVDLPGCYSLTARSLEEQVAHEVLFGRIADLPAPSLVLDIVDASNLERNLYLCTQLIDAGIPIVVVLNMMDIAREKGLSIDPEKLSQTLGCPVVPTIARKGEGIAELLRIVEQSLGNPDTGRARIRPFIENLPPKVEAPVDRLSEILLRDERFPSKDRARPEALWALLSSLEGDDPVRLPPFEIELTRSTLADSGVTTQELRREESEARYGFISDLLQASGFRHEDRPHTLTERLDRFFLHPIWGPTVLFAVFALVFQSIFAWSGPAMEAVEFLFGTIGGGIDAALPDSLFKGLLLDGILAGVGNTVIFLPQVLILFFFLGLLEDSGYLARAAFLLDRLMSSIGLSGKAFIPLLSSFACAVPGIMAARTIPNRKDRLVTILIAPLMACSARLPVYILIIGTVFPSEEKVWGILNLGGVIMLGLYLMGILGAIVMAWIFKKTLLKSPKPVLLLELPTYKLPTLKSILFLLWDRAMIFLRRAGTVILAITILLWGLLSFPRDSETAERFAGQRQEIEANTGLSQESRAEQLDSLAALEAEEQLIHSYGGRLGHLIEPVIKPLGFDWKVGIGLIASFAAREVFVGTLGVIYGISTEADEASIPLRERLLQEKRSDTGKPLYTPLMALSLLLFYVFACQCMSTLAIVRRETMSWRWPLFMLAYMTTLAWVAAFVTYQGGQFLGFE